MFKFIADIRIGVHHAAYHRNLKKAEQARLKKDLNKFQKYIYKSEDAWRKVVIIRNKYKTEKLWENEATKETHQET